MIEAIVASFLVASLSLVGVLFFGKSGHLTGTHRFIIPVAMGVFLGVVFFELIPETLEASEEYGSIAIVAGFLSFYLLSHLLKTYHHHHYDEHDECAQHRSGARKLLIGDAIHNVADGIVITSAFLVDPTIGIATTVGIALHEIPQEIAEFGVLLQAGYTKTKAATYNLLSASSIFLGVVLSTLFIHLGDYTWMLTGVASGNLLYIAASDMLPELNTDEHTGHFTKTFISTIVGLVLVVLLLEFSHELFGGH